MRAQRIASRLIVELCGAKLVPGTIDVAAEIPEPRRMVLRGERVEGLLGMPIEQADQVAYLERLGFGVELAGDDLEVTVPPDRHYDVTREVDLIEEVGRVHGLDEHLPSTLPAVAGRVGGLTREQRLRRRAEDAMRDLGFDEVVGWSFTDPGEAGPAADSRGRPARQRRRALQPALRGPVGDAHDPARLAARRRPAQPRPRRRPRRPLRVRPRLPASCRRGRKDPCSTRVIAASASSAASSRASGRRRTASRTGSAASRSARWRPSPGAAAASRPTSLRSRARWKDWPASSASSSRSSRPRSRSCIPAARPGSSVAGQPAGWIGELHPLVCRAWDLEAAVAFEVDLAALLAASPAGEETFEDVTTFPAVYQDLAVVVPTEVAAAELREAVLGGGGELLHAAEVFDLYEGEQLGEGKQEPRPAARVPRRRPHPHRRGGRRPAGRDRGRAGEDRGVAPWLTSDAQPLDGDPAARVLVAGASGFTGALAAQIVWRHPKLELVAVTSRSDAGKRLDSLYPRYRVPLELTELDLDRVEGVDAAIVAYPHGASAPAVAALRGQGVLVVDLSADFRLRDLATYERWYGEHGAAGAASARRVYGLTEMYREELRSAKLVATPGCYPTASVLALAPLAEKGLLADVVIDAKQGVSGAGRGGGDAMHYVSMDENAFAYKTEGHRHRPEIEQELAALGSPAPVTFVPHLLPLDQGELTSCYAQTSEPISKDEVQALYRERYADEPFVRVVDGPPGLRDVRDTNECHVYVTVEERGRVLAFSAIDNLWKGASGQGVQNLNLMLGLDETRGC